MSKDPFLNETGRTNMGDLSNVRPNTVRIFGADGKVDNSSENDEKRKEVEKLAQELFRADGVAWHKDDEESEKQGKDMFFPRLAIKGLAEKFGVSRPHKEFFAGERNMFVQAFLNDCSEFLFGVPAFNEIMTKQGMAFRPNPEWERLPVK